MNTLSAPHRLASNPRREFLWKAASHAGASLVVFGFLEGRVEALPKNEETDLAILNAAIGIEQEAIALYGDALSRNLVPAGLRDYAVEF